MGGPTVEPWRSFVSWDDQDGLVGFVSVRLTMLPISVEPRAKMKVMARQLPLESSFTVEPTRVPNCLRSTVGRAVAVAARAAIAEAAVNFIFAVWML